MTGPSPGPELLTTDRLSLHYGPLKAVDEVSLRIHAGERHAVIGPNGAGKSSLFSVLAGARRATAGTLHFDGRDVTSWGEASRARAGLVRTFQHANLFLGLTTVDNVRLAVEQGQGRPLRPWPTRGGRALRSRAEEYVDRVGLADRGNHPAASLSHGERRQLEVAIVLASQPRLVLFDEPTAGMSAAETSRFVRLIGELPAEVTTVIVEHDLDVVFQLADRISVLATGRLIASGTPAEVRADPAVAEAYLGSSEGREPLFDDDPTTPELSQGNP